MATTTLYKALNITEEMLDFPHMFFSMFPSKASLIFFGTCFCSNTISRRGGTLEMALSIITQVNNVQLILFHSKMAQSHHNFAFCVCVSCFNFSPNYTWFAGGRSQRQRLLPLEKRNQWEPFQFSPTTSLLFHRLCQKRWQVALLKAFETM